MDNLNTTTEILTVQEARERLPRVRPVVERIMKLAETAAEVRESSPDQATPAQRKQRAHRLEGIRSEFEEALSELNALGAILKDAHSGLIDFYGWIDDELVFLCWCHDEEDVRYWHGVRDGFAGRQLIEEE